MKKRMGDINISLVVLGVTFFLEIFIGRASAETPNCAWVTDKICEGNYIVVGFGEPAGDYPDGAPIVECTGKEYPQRTCVCISDKSTECGPDENPISN